MRVETESGKYIDLKAVNGRVRISIETAGFMIGFAYADPAELKRAVDALATDIEIENKEKR